MHCCFVHHQGERDEFYNFAECHALFVTLTFTVQEWLGLTSVNLHALWALFFAFCFSCIQV